MPFFRDSQGFIDIPSKTAIIASVNMTTHHVQGLLLTLD